MAEFIKLTPEEQEKLNKLIEDQNNSLKKQVEYQSKLSRLRGDELSKAQEEINILADRNRQAEEFLDLLAQQYKNQTELEKSQKRIVENLEEENRRGRLTQENYQTQTQIINTIFETKKKLLTANEEEGKQLLAILAALEKRLVNEQKITAERMRGVDAGKSLIDNATGLLGLTNKTNSATSKFIKSLSGGKEGFAGIAAGARESLLEVVSFENLFSNLIEDIITLGVEFDSIASSFAGVAGRGRELAGVVVGLQAEYAGLGMTQGDLGSALNSLENDFVKFTTLTENQTKAAIGLTAKLEKLGVSANDTADNFNFLMSTMGMGFEESQQAIEKLTLTAAQLSIPFDDMNSAFNTLSPQLVLFGNKGIDIFNRTAAAAKRLGLSVSELGQNLFAIGEGFDEFDEAASKVAALNLTLGGSYLNTYEIVMAAGEGPFEQVKLLQQAFQDAGKSFSDMGFREKQFLSKSIGVDVQTLGTILSDTTLTQEEFAEKTRTIDDVLQDAVPALDKLSSMLQSVATTLGPVIETFANVMQGLANTFGSAFGPIMLGMIAFSGAYMIKTFFAVKNAIIETGARTKELSGALMEMAAASKAAAGAQMELPLGLDSTSDAMEQQAGQIRDNTARQVESINMTDQQTQANVRQGNAIMGVVSALGTLTMAYGLASSGASALMGFLTETVGVSANAAKAITAVVGAMITYAIASYGMGLAKTAGQSGIFAPAAMTAYVAAVGVAIATLATILGDTGGIGAATGAGVSSFASDRQGFNMGEMDVAPGVNDAIIQEQGGKTKITPINKKDELIAAKPAGPVDQAMQQAGGQTTGGVPMRLVTALEKMVGMMEERSRNPGQKTPINVTVELDKRRMGKAVSEIVNKELALT